MKLTFVCLCWIILFWIPLKGQYFQSITVESNELEEERLITVQLPSSYHTNTDTYPVLYILDGEWVFDFAVGTVNHLSNPNLGQIPEMIVIGIPNTDRERDFDVNANPDAGSRPFMGFLAKELKPHIDENFRTNGFDILFGWSSGAEICNVFLADRPDIFDAHIEAGSGILARELSYLTEKIPHQSYHQQFLYVCTEGNTPQRVAALNRFEIEFEKLNPPGLTSQFEVLEKVSHLNVLSKGLYEGLRFVFNPFVIPDSILYQGADAIISYYEEIDKAYDFQVKIPIGQLKECAEMLKYSDKMEDALKLLRRGVFSWGENPHLLGAIGDTYAFSGNKEEARIYFQQAIDAAVDTPELVMKYRVLLQNLEP